MCIIIIVTLIQYYGEAYVIVEIIIKSLLDLYNYADNACICSL